jgi:hypothetical protein
MSNLSPPPLLPLPPPLLLHEDVIKEVELEHLCFDANEIESGVEVVDNVAFVCEVMDNNVRLGL